MTLKELYSQIEGDYNQAISVLIIEKLMDIHIRKFPDNGVVESLLEAGATLDPTKMFESAHAMKGVCANLGLVKLASYASVLSEEFRPGKNRTMTDDKVHDLINEVKALYEKTVAGINQYVSQSENVQ